MVREWNKKIWVINRVDNLNWPLYRDWKSWRFKHLMKGYNAQNVSSVWWSIYIINCVDKPNCLLIISVLLLLILFICSVNSGWIINKIFIVLIWKTIATTISYKDLVFVLVLIWIYTGVISMFILGATLWPVILLQSLTGPLRILMSLETSTSAIFKANFDQVSHGIIHMAKQR